ELQLMRLIETEIAGLARCRAPLRDVAMLVDFNRRLADGVAIFFPRRQVERIRLVLCRRMAIGGELLVRLVDLIFRQVVADAEIAIACRENANVIDHTPVLDLAIWRLDEAELLDAREARQRRDQTD